MCRPVCVSVCQQECVNVWLSSMICQWSGYSTCVFASIALIEGAWSHVSGCHVPQRNAFNVSHSVQHKCVLKTQPNPSIHYASQAPSDNTNCKIMCICIYIYAKIYCKHTIYVWVQFDGNQETPGLLSCICTHIHAPPVCSGFHHQNITRDV